MNKRLLGVATGILALSLTACQGGGTTTSTTTAPGGTSSTAKAGSDSSKYAGQKLSVWIMDGTAGNQADFFKQVGEKFKASTGADLDVQFVPWAAAKDKFQTAIAGGTTPDVAELGFTWVPEYADAGALADLSTYMKDAKLDKGYIPAATEAVVYDGKLYGAPWYAGIRSMVYNKEIFEKAGITSTPANWAELQDAVKKIKETQPDVTPFPIPGSSEFSVYPWIWGAGGKLATSNGDKWTATINSAEAQEGLSFYTDLALKANASTAAATTWNEKDVLTNFQQGNVGMIINGSWTPATIKKASPDFYNKIGAFPIPGKTSGIAPSAVGGSALSVFEASKNKALAWEFTKMMTTGDLAKEWGKSSNFFPTDTAGVDELMKSSDPMVAPFAKQMKEGGATVPAAPAFGKIQSKKTTVTMVQSVLSGKADVKAATEAANKEMQDAYDGK